MFVHAASDIVHGRWTSESSASVVNVKVHLSHAYETLLRQGHTEAGWANLAISYDDPTDTMLPPAVAVDRGREDAFGHMHGVAVREITHLNSSGCRSDHLEASGRLGPMVGFYHSERQSDVKVQQLENVDAL
eukprot:6180186-Pleurochrysis_carterae.AAC.1